METLGWMGIIFNWTMGIVWGIATIVRYRAVKLIMKDIEELGKLRIEMKAELEELKKMNSSMQKSITARWN